MITTLYLYCVKAAHIEFEQESITYLVLHMRALDTHSMLWTLDLSLYQSLDRFSEMFAVRLFYKPPNSPTSISQNFYTMIIF